MDKTFYVVKFKIGFEGTWYSTQELTQYDAEIIERKFHGAGFIARIYKIVSKGEIYVPRLG